MSSLRSRWARGARRGGALVAFGSVLLVTSASATAQGPRWRTGELPLPVMSSIDAAGALRDLAGPADRMHAVVQLSKPADGALRARLRGAGVRLLSCLGENAFFVAVDRSRLDPAVLGRIGELRSACAISRTVKLHPMLSGADIPPWSVVGQAASDQIGAPEPIVAACVLFHSDVPQEEAVALARQHGASVRARLQSVNGLVIELPLSRIPALADEDAIQWIEPPLPQLSELNNGSRAAVQADLVQASPYGLDGSGVVVMLFDGGAPLVSHPDFGGRVTSRDGDALSGHTTHVAGIIGGDGTQSGGLYRGMAPGVTIESYGFEWDPSGGVFLYANPGDIESDYSHAINALGAVLANNSIGSNVELNGFPCELQGDYGITSSIIDAIVRGALGGIIRVVWGNGNERVGSNCDVEGFGDYYSIAPPAGAKNHITVGAINSNNNSMTTFSSWGPTDDGRLKPDVCAAGCQTNEDAGITSCSNYNGYTVKCGTSMSCPAVTGSAALLLQDYRSHFPGRPDFLPSTLKALLAHNALDLGNPGPDYQTGYGLIQIKDTIDHMRTGSFLEAEVDQGETYSFLVNVPPGAPRLQATLAWDDFPGTPNVTVALVNDLDLVAIGPGGTYHPWTLNPGNPAAAAVQTGADHLNNIEQVRVTNPQPGLWTVQVHGFNVPEGPQRFSVAAGPQMVHIAITLDQGPPQIVAPGQPTPVIVRISAAGEQCVPGSEVLHCRMNTGSFEVVPLSPLGGELFQGILPPAECGDTLQYYFTAEGSITGEVSSPWDAPTDTYSPVVGTVVYLFADDIELDRGWTAGAPGDSATMGIWTRVDPNGTLAQPESDHSDDPAATCWVTGQGTPGGALGVDDIDGGATTLTSPTIDLTGAADASISYWRWYSNNTGAAPSEDVFRVDVSNSGGASWVNVETVGPSGPGTSSGWWYHEFKVADFVTPTAQMLVRFVASDEGDPSVVEAAIDDFMVTRFDCQGSPGADPDLDGDGAVGILDMLMLLYAWGPCGGCQADLNGDGVVAAVDLLELLLSWGGGT